MGNKGLDLFWFILLVFAALSLSDTASVQMGMAEKCFLANATVLPQTAVSQ